MKAFRLLVTVILAVLIKFSAGQSTGILNSFSTPGPNNNFLGVALSNSDASVDLYTGTAQVNIPVCELPSKEMAMPVSLNYTGGRGIRVQDYAGIAGLGWQLNAGGSITRVLKGFPDEFPNGYIGTGLWGQQVANAGGNLAQIPTEIQGTSEVVPTADGEPDVFFIRTPTFSGKFVFNESGVPVFENNTGLKVDAQFFYNSTNYAVCYFIITDNHGNKYYFDNPERSTAEIYGQSVNYPSTWYLTRIITFNYRDEITFYYTNGNTYTLNHTSTTATFDYTCGRTDETKTVGATINTSKYLSSITSKGGIVEFTYANDRRDIGDLRLAGITKKTLQGQIIENYTLNYSYFGDPTTNQNLLRLKLDNIQMTGSTTQTATPVTIKTFVYNQAVNLPDRTSQSFDYWGYHNAIGAGDDPFVNPALRAPSNIHAQANILNKITDVTGGETNIAYELNSFLRPDNGQVAYGGGLRVQQISRSMPTGELLYTNYSYTTEAGQNSGQPYSLLYSNLRIGGFQDYQILSENPVNVYDINGVFVGYSSVKATGQNGGYSVSTFTNFSDFPDVINGGISVPAATSYSFKRGLLLSAVVKNAANEKLTEDLYSYSSLDGNPVIRARGVNTQYFYYHAKCCSERWLGVCISWYEGSSWSRTPSTYSYMAENYRLTHTVHRDYDQGNQARYVEQVTDYTYCPDKQLVKTIQTTDSKGDVITKTIYHADDSNIPMLTGSETGVISSMVANNCKSTVIHEKDEKNGILIGQQHNKYARNDVISGSKIFLKEVAAYKGSTLVSAKTTEFDETGSNAVATSVVGGIPVAVQFGHNDMYPIAKVTNATTIYVPTQTTGMLTFGGLSNSFTVDYTGTVTISLGYVSGSGTCVLSYTLTGPSNQSGYLCRSIGGPSCGSTPSSVTFNNMPVGNYVLNMTPVSMSLPSLPQTTIMYPKNVYDQRYEFYYQGFEETTGTTGSAHTGRKYFNASTTPYAVNYTPPSARNYIIQWWNWSNGKWIMNEQPYTGPRTLSGIIDDIRIFPSNSEMTTYTYDQLIGKTGEIDPTGLSMTYQYDGYGRLAVTRDNDRNIVSVTCRNFAGQPVVCAESNVFTNSVQTRSIARNDCPPGQIGTPVTYTVPAGKYTSYLDQADANQMAVNEIDLLGQAYANNPANGSVCTVPGVTLVYNNQTANTWTLTATNTSTGLSYPCNLTASFNGNLCVNLPAGTYTFVFNSGAQALPRSPRITVNGVVQNLTGTTNVSATFTNVSVTASPANPFITIALQDPTSCTFSPASGFGIPSSSISSSGGTVNFYIVFYATSPVSYSSPTLVATINGGCAPSATRTFTKTDGSGRNWEVQVYSNGQMRLRLISGTPPSPGNSVYLSGCTYAL